MEKKIIIKRKIKIISFILFLLVVFLLYFLLKALLNVRVKNIFVSNNKYLSDDYIIEKAKLIDYPSYFKSLSFLIENDLEEDIFIKDASVNKSFFGVINISIEENSVLFYKESDGKYVLEDGSETLSIPYYVSPIRVVNYIPDTVYDNFIKKLNKINESVKSKISDYNDIYPTLEGKKGILYLDSGNHFVELK